LDILGVYLLLVAFAGGRERKDRNFLLFELFEVLNLLDSNWLEVTHFWLLYLIVVAESVRCSLPSRGPLRRLPAQFEPRPVIARVRIERRHRRPADCPESFELADMIVAQWNVPFVLGLREAAELGLESAKIVVIR
jgi:hypothetical protein